MEKNDKVKNELKNSFQEKINNVKIELKNIIQASEANILLEFEDLKFRFRQLETENEHLKDSIEQLKRKSRKNNIILFGWTASNGDINSDFICTELNRLLGVEVHGIDINDFFCLGNKSGRPVKVEFVSYLRKIDIIKNTKNLKELALQLRMI